MHWSRLFILVGAVVGAGALALPLVEFPVQGSINGIEGDMWPAIALVAVPALAAVLGDRAEGFNRVTALVAISASSLALVFAAFKIADAVRATKDSVGSLGPGGWVVGGACLVVLVASVTALTKRLA